MKISISLICFGSVVIFTNLLIINIGAEPIPEANPSAESRPDPNAAAWPDSKALAEARADPVALPDANANPLPSAYPLSKARYKGKYKISRRNNFQKTKNARGRVTKNNKNNKNRKINKISKTSQETKIKAAKAEETPKKTGVMHSLKSATKAGMADATGSFGTVIVQTAVEDAASKFLQNLDGASSNEEDEESNAEEEEEEKQKEQRTETVTKVEESKETKVKSK